MSYNLPPSPPPLPPPGKPIQIFVDGFEAHARVGYTHRGSRTLVLNVLPFSTVADIKKSIEDATGAPMHRMRLAVHGTFLQDDYTVADANLSNGATVTAMMSLLSGCIRVHLLDGTTLFLLHHASAAQVAKVVEAARQCTKHLPSNALCWYNDKFEELMRASQHSVLPTAATTAEDLFLVPPNTIMVHVQISPREGHWIVKPSTFEQLCRCLRPTAPGSCHLATEDTCERVDADSYSSLVTAGRRLVSNKPVMLRVTHGIHRSVEQAVDRSTRVQEVKDLVATKLNIPASAQRLFIVDKSRGPGRHEHKLLAPPTSRLGKHMNWDRIQSGADECALEAIDARPPPPTKCVFCASGDDQLTWQGCLPDLPYGVPSQERIAQVEVAWESDTSKSTKVLTLADSSVTSLYGNRATVVVAYGDVDDGHDPAALSRSPPLWGRARVITSEGCAGLWTARKAIVGMPQPQNVRVVSMHQAIEVRWTRPANVSREAMWTIRVRDLTVEQPTTAAAAAVAATTPAGQGGGRGDGSSSSGNSGSSGGDGSTTASGDSSGRSVQVPSDCERGRDMSMVIDNLENRHPYQVLVTGWNWATTVRAGPVYATPKVDTALLFRSFTEVSEARRRVAGASHRSARVWRQAVEASSLVYEDAVMHRRRRLDTQRRKGGAEVRHNSYW